MLYCTVFGTPAKLLSDHGANFTSALVEELCSTFGIQKCRTTAYHPQCNGQVERFHQMLFWMIGKLAVDKKAHWEQHLSELIQAYNSTRSTVTGYSPHYLDVWEETLPPCWFFLPHHRHECMPLLSPHVCRRGVRVLQRSLYWSPAPIQQWSGLTKMQLW